MSDVHDIRRFTDDQGIEWEVWEAHPRLADRRRARDRRVRRRDTPDRRTVPSQAAASPWAGLLPDGAGWLVFRSAREERRRAPIADGWEDMSAEQLVGLLRQSRATGPYPRMRAPWRGEIAL